MTCHACGAPAADRVTVTVGDLEPTVADLRAALVEALRYAREYYAAAYGGDIAAGELAHLDKLEALL